MRRALLLFASVAAFGIPAVSVHAETVPTATRPINSPYAGFIAEASQRFGIPAAWIRAIMRTESHDDPRAISHKGAMGLMQIMPETWTALRARNGFGRDPFDPHDNILAGAAYLREMHDRYGLPGFLAAYNAGPGRYEAYRDRGRPLPPETVAYVADLLPLLGDGTVAGPALTIAANSPPWMQAPLFIARTASTERSNQSASRPGSSDTAAAVALRDLSGIAPQSEGLFVRISATGSTP
jgi:membrane-bound lytic murein transglycosylase B